MGRDRRKWTYLRSVRYSMDRAATNVDGERNRHRDDSNRFRRNSVEGDRWVKVRGSGADREH